MSLVRAQGSDPQMVNQHFDLLEPTLEENDLTDYPGKFFNIDESSIPLDPKAPKVVVERGYSVTKNQDRPGAEVFRMSRYCTLHIYLSPTPGTANPDRPV